MSDRRGQVALVGAGPGHPGLLTLRGAELLQRADLVLYDRLVPQALLHQCPPTARCVCIDELPGEHPLRYPHIHAAMIEAAQAGQRVVRLKGGDPFVFGRGAEEAVALRQAGIDFEIVPGVTAGLGVPAFAGIPVTHRQLASAVAFITGHEHPGKAESALDWSALAAFPGTLVFYMGVGRLAALAETLIDQGKSPDTPAALIEQGTTARQRTLCATLATLPALAQREGVGAPALTVIGDVVRVRHEIAWREALPLFGQRLLLTRPRQLVDEMVQAVLERGGEPLVLPVVEVAEPLDWQAVDRAIAQIESYDWLVFTSVNGVSFFFNRLRAMGRDVRALGRARFAAIGPATADALRARYLEPDLVPPSFNSEGLVAALRERVAGQRVLLARADRGLELLREELSPLATVEQIAVYRQLDEPLQGPVVEMLQAGQIDWVTLTSSNIARGIERILGPQGRSWVESGRTRLAAISPRTAQATTLPVAAVAKTYTTQGVLEAIEAVVNADL
ncbi:MAG: uroporphyrinogen-III C-methyltransferase [Gemmataceae bacterium]